MKITEVRILIEGGTEEEQNKYPHGIVLIRGKDKIWSATDEIGVMRGLFPYEVRLANNIQELIVAKFNGGKS